MCQRRHAPESINHFPNFCNQITNNFRLHWRRVSVNRHGWNSLINFGIGLKRRLRWYDSWPQRDPWPPQSWRVSLAHSRVHGALYPVLGVLQSTPRAWSTPSCLQASQTNGTGIPWPTRYIRFILERECCLGWNLCIHHHPSCEHRPAPILEKDQ